MQNLRILNLQYENRELITNNQTLAQLNSGYEEKNQLLCVEIERLNEIMKKK